MSICPECQGDGKIERDGECIDCGGSCFSLIRCDNCNGTGKTEEKRKLTHTERIKKELLKEG